MSEFESPSIISLVASKPSIKSKRIGSMSETKRSNVERGGGGQEGWRKGKEVYPQIRGSLGNCRTLLLPIPASPTNISTQQIKHSKKEP
jgi:hypothetical protein